MSKVVARVCCVKIAITTPIAASGANSAYVDDSDAGPKTSIQVIVRQKSQTYLVLEGGVSNNVLRFRQVQKARHAAAAN